jgi:hypothetical protein
MHSSTSSNNSNAPRSRSVVPGANGRSSTLAARSLAAVQQVEGNAALLLHDLQRDYIRRQREKLLLALHTRLLDGTVSVLGELGDSPEICAKASLMQK